MQLKQVIATARALAWTTFYQNFEQIVVLILTWLIAIVVVFAIWNLTLKILLTMVMSGSFDPTDYPVFQTIFGMIFTVIIALEFKRSLVVMAERRESIVQVRTVVLIALLAVIRKLLIIDPNSTDALHLLALSAAILALGGVYWLVRYGDRPESAQRLPHGASRTPHSADSGVRVPAPAPPTPKPPVISPPASAS